MRDITGAPAQTEPGSGDANQAEGSVVADLRSSPAEAGERDTQAVSRFHEDFVFALLHMGFPRMPARVFVELITNDSGRLTAAELATALQASPGGVSGAVRYLIQLGLVRREGEPGSRRHYYRVPDRWWDDVVGIRENLMGRWAGVMREGAVVLGPDTPAGARVAESARYFEFLSSEMPQVMRRWREHQAEREGGPGSGH
jgi:predicted transcriptional regulator